jgi:hypothetical protein
MRPLTAVPAYSDIHSTGTNSSKLRSGTLRPFQMLRAARMAGLVKLRCSVRLGYESRLWAGHVMMDVELSQL